MSLHVLHFCLKGSDATVKVIILQTLTCPWKTKQAVWHAAALSAVWAAHNQERFPYRSHLSAERLHAFKNTILHSGSSSSSTVHQFVFEGGRLACHLQLLPQPMKYLWCKILLFDMSCQPFSIHLKLQSVLPRNEGKTQSKSVGAINFSVSCHAY